MLRALAAALFLCTVAAGCGSAHPAIHTISTSQPWASSPADRAGASFGDAHPSVALIETAQLLDGRDADVLELHGRFSFIPTCIARSGKHSCPGRVRFDSVQLVVDAHSHKPIMSGNDPFPGELRAIARAKRANSLFGIFPDFGDLPVRCTIPSAGAGTCESTISDRGETKVEFLEHWPLSARSGTRNTGGWVVTLSRSGQVLSIHTQGQTPPQLPR